MKIERITVCNIASLAGTHSVDFTQKPLRSAGLFSISGATGAGKSTLLDALCLALFDQTPRLQIAKSSRAELNDGEKQNDTRMLLRRNTAQGFAEVAFVGIDRQRWTARWSVRRSRNSVDGKLQNVEMTLFEGHIAPGGAGKVAAGGKKTQVKDAIVERIGLTFEQFTRAVLLAQNDFATFLKATDQERAAILQALTGTERFEQIGRAVFARYAQERDTIAALQARLQGHQPLSDEERSAAEAVASTTAAIVVQLETQGKQYAEFAKWFERQTKLTNTVKDCQTAVTTAAANVDAAKARRVELQYTEETAHQARSLRHTQQHAAREQHTAKDNLQRAVQQQSKLTQELATAAEQHKTAVASQQETLHQQQAAQPILIKARELDARLPQLQLRVNQTSLALQTANTNNQDAQATLQRETQTHQQLQIQQQQLQDKQSQLEPFSPFVSELSLWLSRMDRAREAAESVRSATQQTAALAADLNSAQQQLTALQHTTDDLRQQYEAAASSLKDAETVRDGFDAEQLAKERNRCIVDHEVLTTFQQQLKEHQQRRVSADETASELQSFQNAAQTAQTDAQALIDVKIPRAQIVVETARAQLERITAAVDDHAQRLRLSLQASHPCPVCGSCEHPYRDHAPDADSTALLEAQAFLNEQEQTRDHLKSDLQQKQLQIRHAAQQIEKLQQRHSNLQQALSQPQWSAPDHPRVAAALLLPDDRRISAVQQELQKLSKRRLEIADNEDTLRKVTQLVQECRKQVDMIREQQQSVQQQLSEQEKTCEVLHSQHASAVKDREKAARDLQTATDALGGLFSSLPNSKERFTADSKQFRETFQSSVEHCGRIDQELTAVQSAIQQLTAKIEPLQTTAVKAKEACDQCLTQHTAAAAEHDSLLAERKAVFEGRAADEVEQELVELRRKADANVEDCRNTQHALEKSLAAADQSVESFTKQVSEKEQALQNAQAALSQWLEAFAQRTQQPCSMELLDQRLARDAHWIAAERQALQQLDEAVTKAQTTLDLQQQELEQHRLQRPTDETEAAVHEKVQQLLQELKQAKESHEHARDVVRDDDQRRRQNAELTAQLHTAQATADPWNKLNELVGSKEGDKFRMIAQRRTLDVLLSYANQQLHLLSARYRLERAAESLNLSVIDCDMGEDRRSIHSLSGGESFLVSLALALGLASLTSNRLPIESLFIDEGFGSLDPETLNTAMNALTHLEAQGRKVGVISHVKEMTDAIPVQIRVEKQRAGGASKIVIPGADPDVVNPPTEFEGSSNRRSAVSGVAESPEIRTIANEILTILKRESADGNSKVSTVAMRKEIGCQAPELKAAQTLLNGAVTQDGRSLRLVGQAQSVED